jgi:hypothetical protein
MDQVSIGSAKLWAELERRAWGERAEAEIALRDLVRYYRLLAGALEGLGLSEQEGLLIWRALTQFWTAGTEQHQQSPPFPSLAAAVAAEWRRLQGSVTVEEVQIDDLVGRLERLSPAQTLALIDACERFQAHVQRQGWRPVPQLLQEVGLLRD